MDQRLFRGPSVHKELRPGQPVKPQVQIGEAGYMSIFEYIYNIYMYNIYIYIYIYVQPS